MKIFECDGCKTQVKSEKGHKPDSWFERTDFDSHKEMHACSRDCIEKIPGRKTILPI